MFPAFKFSKVPKHFLLSLLMLFFSSEVAALEVANPEEHLRGMENPPEIMAHFPFLIEQLEIQVFLVNWGEPQGAPQSFQVFFRCDPEADYKIRDRSIDGAPARYYKELAEPQRLTDDPRIGPGDFLALFGFELILEDDGHGQQHEVLSQFPKVELYPISEFIEQC